MDLGLNGRTAVITGGNSGIGVGLSREFAREGCNVVIAARDVERSHQVAEQAEQLGGKAIAIQTDITNRRSVDAMVAQTLELYGSIEILVNNAGGPRFVTPFEDMKAEDIQWELDLNIWGVVNCTQAVGREMISKGYGSIVNISSQSSLLPKAGSQLVNYAGSKGYINSFTKALAFDWAAKGIRVNNIAPGWILPYTKEDVSSGSNWKRFAFDFFGDPETMREKVAKGEGFNLGDDLLIRRAGSPTDIAYAALFLASDVSSYITGALISIGGGGYMPT